MANNDDLDAMFKSSFSKEAPVPDHVWSRISSTIESRSGSVFSNVFLLKRTLILAFSVCVIIGGVFSGVSYYENQQLDAFLYQVFIEDAYDSSDFLDVDDDWNGTF